MMTTSKTGLRTTAAGRTRIVVALMLLIVATLKSPESRIVADDWPQWRGPLRNAVSAETSLLRSWSEDGPKLAWKVAGLGTGYASVVIRRGRVYTIGKHGTKLFVTALEANTGKLAWARNIGMTARIPCSTPTVDDDRLYALGPDGDLVCLNSASGEILWQKSFLRDFDGRMMSGRGFGESPLVDGEKLICTPGGANTALVALNKRTGAILWKSQVPDIGSAGTDGAGFSSVVATEAAGVRQYVQLLGRGVVGVDARDGRFLWGYNAIANTTANIPTPIVRGDLVFVANGNNAGSVLLELLPNHKQAEAGPGVKARTVYALQGSKFQNHHGGVVLVGNHIYGGHGSNNGLPTCVELKTGRVLWKRRGPGEGSAAVVYADGHLYFRFQNGVVALIEANAAGYYLKGTLRIPGAGGDSWAHPVVANGLLYLREQDALWVHDLKHDTTTKPANPTTPPLAQHPVLTELRNHGIAFEPISTGRSEKARRIHGFAIGQDRAAAPLLVALAEKHFTPAGTIRQEVMGCLVSLPLPIVLNLAGTSVRDAGLKQLRACKRVLGLDLEFCRHVSDVSLKSLQELQQLRVLILTGTSVTEWGIRNLAPNKNLTALDLEVCDAIGDAACEALAELRQLKALVVKKTGFETQRISDAGLRHLRNLSHLEALNLYGNQVTDAGLVYLKGLTKLRELNLSLLPITDRGLANLLPLSNLERLELMYSEGFAGPAITNGATESLRELTNLKTLNLTGARLTDAGLDRLRALKKLALLQLVNTGVSMDGIRVFKAVHSNCRIIR